MKCMKCGRETTAEQVFCQECLLDMQKYPVKPGTAVMLPKRRDSSVPRKAPKRRTPNTEDQLRMLRKRVHLLTALLLLALVLIVCLAIPTVEYLRRNRVRPGQNYSSIVSTSASTDTVPESS